MPKKRNNKKIRNDEQYARYVLEVIVAAVGLLLLVLLFFAWDEPQTSAGAGGGVEFSDKLADYVRECSQGVTQACDKIADVASSVEVPVQEYDAERERLRQERIVG